jgi:hypothetical protein
MFFLPYGCSFLTAYRSTAIFFSFLRAELFHVCDWPHLLSQQLSSHVDYSSTAHTASSSRSLITSGSLIMCKLVQVQHHHPRSTVPLYIIYPGAYLVWATHGDLSLGDFPFMLMRQQSHMTSPSWYPKKKASLS